MPWWCYIIFPFNNVSQALLYISIWFINNDSYNYYWFYSLKYLCALKCFLFLFPSSETLSFYIYTIMCELPIYVINEIGNIKAFLLTYSSIWQVVQQKVMERTVLHRVLRTVRHNTVISRKESALVVLAGTLDHDVIEVSKTNISDERNQRNWKFNFQKLNDSFKCYCEIILNTMGAC